MKPIIRTCLAAFVAGSAGAGLVLVGQGVELRLKPVSMSYQDWVTLLLAMVAILMTALGVVIAIAAIWGFGGIKQGAEAASIKHVAEALNADGELSDKLDDAFDKFIQKKLDDRAFRQLLEDRVNAILFLGPEERAREDLEDDFEDEAFEEARHNDTGASDRDDQK